MFAFETEDVLQAWALPIENIIGVGGFVLALAANPLTSGVGREGSLGCSASFVPLERFRLSLIEDVHVSEIKIEENRFRRQLRFEGDVRERRCFERVSGVEETRPSINLPRVTLATVCST